MFDAISSMSIVATVWETIRFYGRSMDDGEIGFEMVLGECVNNVLKRALLDGSEDNVSVVLVFLKSI